MSTSSQGGERMPRPAVSDGRSAGNDDRSAMAGGSAASDGGPAPGGGPAACPHVPVDGGRYRRILRFAVRILVTLWWFDLLLPRIGFARYAARGRAARVAGMARRFRGLAVELGGLMIKAGQFMSSRLDVLPPEITRELADLQDEVPPVPFEAIRTLAEAELGAPLERAYARFDPAPVAAASLGQAHRARLTDAAAADVGFAEVVVKVQRPGINAIVDVDLAALRRIARWLARIRVVTAHVDAPALVEEFARTSLEEVDYLHEGAAAERFADAFADDARVDAPQVVWERTTRRVLTLSDVTAIKITDVDALRAAGIDPAEVARTFADVMLGQLFERGFFHADPHPGNVFVTPAPGGDPAWRLTFVDFGMMADIPTTLRDGLRAALLAVVARDGTRVVEAMEGVGVLLPHADTRQLERAMTGLFHRFGGMGFAQLREVDPREFRAFADDFGDVMRSLPFQLPQNFLLIIRAMSLMSGVCSGLDPRFNLWDSIEPFAADLGREEGGRVARDLLRQAGETAGILWRLPARVDALIDDVEKGRISVDVSHLERRVAHLERLGSRVVSSVLFAALLVGGALLLPHAGALGVVLICVSVLPLVHALFTGWARRR